MKETDKNEKVRVYQPEPVDTSDVVVPEELMELVEEMSRNVHEVWAKSRIDQGWTWGEKRDDQRKSHPDLVPYDELPEEEKDYDRNTSLETIKMILKLGFRISKIEKNGGDCYSKTEQTVTVLMAQN